MFRNIDGGEMEKFEGVVFRNSCAYDVMEEKFTVNECKDYFTVSDGDTEYNFYNKDIPKIIKALNMMHKHFMGEDI